MGEFPIARIETTLLVSIRPPKHIGLLNQPAALVE
jgi:hypothetical protein